MTEFVDRAMRGTLYRQFRFDRVPIEELARTSGLSVSMVTWAIRQHTFAGREDEPAPKPKPKPKPKPRPKRVEVMLPRRVYDAIAAQKPGQPVAGIVLEMLTAMACKPQGSC